MDGDGHLPVKAKAATEVDKCTQQTCQAAAATEVGEGMQRTCHATAATEVVKDSTAATDLRAETVQNVLVVAATATTTALAEIP